MYDVIVAGAGYAGATTALLLARAGVQVLLIGRTDAADAPPMSAPLLWPRAVAALERWGLLGRLSASGCPPLHALDLQIGRATARGAIAPAPAYAPRRRALLGALVEAALRAGADVEPGFEVERLLVADGRVRGIAGRGRYQAGIGARAHLVVGADGRHSLVARAVRATELNLTPPVQGAYTSAWSNVPLSEITFALKHGCAASAWPTGDGLAVVTVHWPARAYFAARADPEAAYLRALERAAPALASRVRSGARRWPFCGGAAWSVLRATSGPGWALVGDAARHTDPITAHGVADAFHDAELLAEAIAAGLGGRQPLEQALVECEQRREAVALDLAEFTAWFARLTRDPLDDTRAASLLGDPPLRDALLGALAGSPLAAADFRLRSRRHAAAAPPPPGSARARPFAAEWP